MTFAEKVERISNEFKQAVEKKYTILDIKLFGSAARGDYSDDSDIDLMVKLPVVNQEIEEDIFDMAFDLGLKYDCPIDVIVFPEDVPTFMPLYQNIEGGSARLTKEEKITLIQSRRDRSEEALKAAQLFLEKEHYISTLDRLYYSMFYAVQALQVLSETRFSKQNRIKDYFVEEYVNRGIFPEEFGKFYNLAFEYQEKFDSANPVALHKEFVVDFMTRANIFVEKTNEYIQDKIASL